jgi:hypothetical protein
LTPNAAHNKPASSGRGSAMVDALFPMAGAGRSRPAGTTTCNLFRDCSIASSDNVLVTLNRDVTRASQHPGGTRGILVLRCRDVILEGASCCGQGKR